MGKYLLRILIFVLLVLVSDRAISPLIGRYLVSIQYDKRWSRLKNGEVYDVIVVGSSRAARNIDAGVLADELEMSVLNLGQPGSNVDYHCFVVRFMLACGLRPKYILYAVDPWIFIPNDDLVFRYDKLYPYVGYRVVEDELKRRGEINRIYSTVLESYKYKKNFPDAIYGSVGPGVTDTISSDGSMLLWGHSKKFAQEKYTIDPIYDIENEDPALTRSLEEIIEVAGEQGSVVLLCSTPNYGKKHRSAMNRIREVAGVNEKQYYEYDAAEFSSFTLFYDYGHLNVVGAKKYSKKLSEWLREKWLL